MSGVSHCQPFGTMAREHNATLARYAERPDTQASGHQRGHPAAPHPGVAENPPVALAAFHDVDLSTLGDLASLNTRIRDQAFDRAGQEPVILMAGGNASGKSTFSYQIIRQGFKGAIVDSPWVAESDVRKVLNRVGKYGWSTSKGPLRMPSCPWC